VQCALTHQNWKLYIRTSENVIARRLGGLSRPPRVGDVVLLEPSLTLEARSAVWRSLSAQSMIKRIVEITPAGYRVAGDSASSLGSESFGTIVRADVVARIWLRIPKDGALKVIRHRPQASAGTDALASNSGQAVHPGIRL